MEYLSILITGASTGIGQDAALSLARKGHQVFAGVRNVKDGDALKAACADLIPVVIDVTKTETINSAFQQIQAQRKTNQKFCLVNNAGIAVASPMETVSMDEMRGQFDVNVFGLVAVTQKFLPWIRQSQGRIVNISSISGKVTRAFLGPYSASKYAVEAISDALRRELAKFGVRVVLVEPGPIKTPIWDKGISKAFAQLESGDPVLRAVYEADARILEKGMRMIIEHAAPVSRSTEAIEQALTHPRPKTRYPVGKIIGFAIFLNRMMPDRWMDKLMARQLL